VKNKTNIVKSKTDENIKVILAEMSALNSEIEQFLKKIPKIYNLAILRAF